MPAFLGAFGKPNFRNDVNSDPIAISHFSSAANHGKRMFLWFLLLTVNLCFNSSESFSKIDGLRWVAPRAHEWKNAEIDQNVKVYWENRWAKASFLKGCSEENSLKIVPVYFWPGERVDLPCRMCQWAHVMNGRMKRWGYSEDVDEFLLNPQQFVRVYELWQEVENTEDFDRNQKYVPDENDVIYFPQKVEKIEKEKEPPEFKLSPGDAKEPPRFWQNDGKLVIFGADVRAQGVYFCYDELSRKQTSVFFVLSAMIPPALFFSDTPTIYTDHCGQERGKDSTKIFPSHNWRFHFLPMGDLNPPASCQLDPLDTETCSEKFPYLKRENWPANFEEDCTMDRCRARVISPDGSDLDLFVELRWDDWTSCSGDQPTKRREAHCYIVRGPGSINIESMDSDYKKLYSWLKEIENVFDQKPFDTHGIRLHSSIVTSAIFGKTKITGCYNEKDEQNELYEKYDLVWRRVFLPTLGVPFSGEQFQLGNPFEACLRYSRTLSDTAEERENIIGTHSTQVDYC